MKKALSPANRSRGGNYTTNGALKPIRGPPGKPAGKRLAGDNSVDKWKKGLSYRHGRYAFGV